MSRKVESLCFSADFSRTYRTVNYAVVRACNSTGRFNSVFLYCCACGVIKLFNCLGVAVATNRTSVGHFACFCTCSFLGFLTRVFVSVLNMLVKPSILHLRIALVGCDDTIKGYLITNNGLGFHRIISCISVCTIETVDVEGVAICILNIHITVLSINDLGNSTCHVILFGCSSKRTEKCCLCKCKSRICRRRNYNVATVVITNVIAVCINVIALCRNVLGHPTVLHLRSGVITDNTVNGDCVACNGLGFHSIISCISVCAIETVNKNLIAVLVLDVHITVSNVGNVNDCTGNIVLVSSIIILCIKCAKCKSLLNGKLGICRRRNYCSAVIIALVVTVCIGMFCAFRSTGTAYRCHYHINIGSIYVTRFIRTNILSSICRSIPGFSK